MICYKHTTHLDSLDDPNESKWPSSPSSSPPSLSLLGVAQVLTPPAPIAETWSHVACFVSGPASPICILGYISITCACASSSRGSGCSPGQPVAAVETSVATDVVSYDAGPRLTPVTFLSTGTQWAQASSTGHDFFELKLNIAGLELPSQGNRPCWLIWGAPFGSFNLELRPLTTEATFSLIVRKKIRCFWKTKPTVGVLYLAGKKIKNKKIYILEEIYLLKRSTIDRNIFQKRDILKYVLEIWDIY